MNIKWDCNYVLRLYNEKYECVAYVECFDKSQLINALHNNNSYYGFIAYKVINDSLVKIGNGKFEKNA